MMKMYRMSGNDMGGMSFPTDATLVVNASSPLITRLSSEVESDEGKAEKIAKQIYTLALLSQRQLTADELQAFLTDSFDMLDVVKKAVEHKVAVVPGTAFLNDENAKTNSFRLNFSTPTDEQIVKGIDILAEVLNSMK